MLQRGEKCETKGMKAKVRANKGLMGREEREERVGGGGYYARNKMSGDCFRSHTLSKQKYILWPNVRVVQKRHS
jgi:hypothetical protein